VTTADALDEPFNAAFFNLLKQLRPLEIGVSDSDSDCRSNKVIDADSMACLIGDLGSVFFRYCVSSAAYDLISAFNIYFRTFMDLSRVHTSPVLLYPRD